MSGSLERHLPVGGRKERGFVVTLELVILGSIFFVVILFLLLQAVEWLLRNRLEEIGRVLAQRAAWISCSDRPAGSSYSTALRNGSPVKVTWHDDSVEVWLSVPRGFPSVTSLAPRPVPCGIDPRTLWTSASGVDVPKGGEDESEP